MPSEVRLLGFKSCLSHRLTAWVLSKLRKLPGSLPVIYNPRRMVQHLLLPYSEDPCASACTVPAAGLHLARMLVCVSAIVCVHLYLVVFEFLNAKVFGFFLVDYRFVRWTPPFEAGSVSVMGPMGQSRF